MLRIVRPGPFALALLLASAPGAAQIPDQFTNLQVLPADIERRQLVEIMRGFAGDLGVRCNFCHVGEDPDSLEGYAFASDENSHKRIARVMMTMTRTINETHLPQMGKEVTHPVTCVTCHSGRKEPTTLSAELLSAYDDAGGAAAMMATYRSLRDELYGRGVFDFGETALLGIATELARARQDLAGAGALLELNLEFFPASFFTWAAIGQLRQMEGDTDGAIAALEKALEIQPDNPQIRQMLERLKQ